MAKANAETVQGFSLNSGSLSAATNPIPTTTNGGIADTVTAIPNGNLLFLATAEGSIFADTVAKDGTAQAANNGRPVATISNPALISTDRTGKLLLAVSNSPTLQIFQIDASNGGLQPATEGAIPLDSGQPTQLYVTSDNRYIFVALGGGGVDGFTLNAENGTVDNRVHVAPLQAGSQDDAVASDGNSSDLFVGEKGSGIRVLAIGSGGALTEMPGSPFAAQSGGPSSLVVGPANGELYAGYPAANEIAAYGIGPSGGLTLISNTTFSVAPSPTALSMDTTGTHLLALSNRGSLQVFNVDSGVPGKLTEAAVAGSISAAAAGN